MLVNLKSFNKIYLYRPIVDFRKGINGLSSVVQDEMRLSPFEKYLFVFCNRSHNRLKVLYWDKTGFALWYKQLEKDKFKWPSHLEADSLSVDSSELKKFLLGLDPWQVEHKELHFSQI